MTRNPLASPDIIGFTTGAATGALTIILVAGESTLGTGSGALLGGMLTATAVWLFASQRGLSGEGLILAGIAFAAMLGAVNDFLLTRADLDAAVVARTWLFGSLHGTGWGQAIFVLLAGTPLLAAALALAHRLRMFELGDDIAGMLGVPTTQTRLLLGLIATALTGVAIAGAGPIGFVALAAPQLARRLIRNGTISLRVTALMGALLVATADLIGQRLLAPAQIPAGLVTGALGGLYLAWLLWHEWQKDTVR